MSILSFVDGPYPDGGPPIVVSVATDLPSSDIIVTIYRPEWSYLKPPMTTWDGTVPWDVKVITKQAWKYRMRFNYYLWYTAKGKYYMLHEAFGSLDEKHPEIREWLKRLAEHEGFDGSIITYSQRPEEVGKLPGAGEIVKHPQRGTQEELFAIIVSLNDRYKWTREQIADWLETLDLDLTFKDGV